MADIRFGEIEKIKEGDIFSSREELSLAGVHRPRQGGIDGNGKEGTSSIVLSGGYVDDEDNGDEIIYTGHGGQDANTKKQVRDQSWETYGNKGLLISELHGLPIRVTRGANHKSEYSPEKGYKYGGLYQVTDHFWKKEEGQFGVCRFKLVKIFSSNFTEDRTLELLTGNDGPAPRVATTVLRIIRDTKLSREIKRLYNYTCQVCGIRIALNGIGYAEAAHIRPLGKPHDGADSLANLLCLCPNHHVMFDKGHFRISSNFLLIGIEGKLNVHKKHIIDMENIIYHYDYSRID